MQAPLAQRCNGEMRNMKRSFLRKAGYVAQETGIRLLVFIMVFTWMFSGWPNLGVFGDLFRVENAEAAGIPGDFAIYREATAGEVLDGGGTILTHDYDTVVATSSSISLAGDNATFNLQSGHYAVMYGTRFDSTGGTNRSAVNSMLVLNGATTSIGWSQGYTRRSNGDNEVLASGGGIIDVTSDGDPLVFRSERADVNTAGLERASNVTGINILKLDDSWDYIRLSKTGTQTGPTSAGSWTAITYNRQDEYDTGSFTHSTTVGSEDVTLKTAGHYLVFANTFAAIPSGSSDRTLVAQKLTLDGSDVSGSYTTVYIRGNTNSEAQYDGAVAIGTIIETTSDNQVLNVEIDRPDGTTALTVNQDRTGVYRDATALTIVKLPDGAEYIRLDDTGTDDMNPTVMTSMGWDTEDEEDVESFAHPAPSQPDSAIGFNKDGNYLFLTALYAQAAGVARAKTNQGWSINSGAMLSYGQTGQYNRNSGANDAGNWSGIIIPNLTTSDYVEVESVALGQTGVIGADDKGLQGVNIDTLFAGSMTVSAIGTQQGIDIPSTESYVGGAFVFTDDMSTRDITSITITASGTADYVNDLDNIELWYDLDITSPYNCASESYDGDEVQFGLTDTDGFTSGTGTSTFTGTTTVETASSTMCLYVVVDVGLGAANGETLDISIADPSTDVIVSRGYVLPATEVGIPGVTTLRDDVLTQTHYHWRADDASESLASSLTSNVEDTIFSNVAEGETIRLRLEVSNEGGTTSAPVSYRLEFGEKITTCSDIGTWERVWALDGAWDPSDSLNLTEGANTTNISTTTYGGVTDENTTFKTPNGGVRDASDETGPITLASDEFVELEYAIEATKYASDGTTYCFRVTDAGTPFATSAYSVYPEATFNVHLQASTTGSQTSNIDIPSTDIYTGGTFVIEDVGAGDTHTITNVTITETGTIDAQTDLDNIELWYDLDTSFPYDCASETYTDGATQFGATDTDGFSSANGVSTFSGSLQASSTQSICLYPVLDILPSAQNGDTLALQITAPSIDIVASGGDAVRPSDPVVLAGTTILRDDVLTQIHYHWRNDDSSEATSTSAVTLEDFPLLAIAKGVTKRIRIEVSNEGATSSAAVQYRLEYGEKIGTCDAIETWTDVGAVGGDWDMSDSVYLTDGEDTTNVSTTTYGGVTDENTVFKTPNGAVKDTSSQTSAITLSESEFLELEYSVVASSSAVDGTTYCFRLSDAGTPFATSSYVVYPRATISPDVTVSATGTQAVNLDAPTADNYVGGMFVIKDGTGEHTITSITITETGTIDAQTDLDNIELWYDLDTSFPYDCASETYTDGATQFGATDTDGFSSANGVSTFSGSAGISTSTTMCAYVVLDIGSGASNGETLDIEITNPSVDVVPTEGVVVPGVPVELLGSTNIRAAVLTQDHYHWRDDSGNEIGASSLTSGTEDTPYTMLGRGVTTRLRLEVSNEGCNVIYCNVVPT
jgi:hypothetical protein